MSPSAKQPSGSGGGGSPSGRPESTKPSQRCCTPRISAARAISARRIGGHVVEHARPVHRGVEDAAALAAGAGDDHDLAPLVDVAGARGGALAGLVVRVGVHGHHAQGPPVEGAVARCAGVRRSTSGAAVLPVLVSRCAESQRCAGVGRRRAFRPRERSSGIVAETPDSSVCPSCNSATRASLPGSRRRPRSAIVDQREHASAGTLYGPEPFVERARRGDRTVLR